MQQAGVDMVVDEVATMRRVTLTLIPFLMVCYMVAFLDRVNVGFAALQMNHAIGLSPAVFGLGSGIFFIAYFIFEVPSNLLMQRVGARRWIARIMVSWGIVSAATAFITGPVSFYVARFVLGAAEAGFFPGVLLYITLWFPSVYRARVVALFYIAVPISSFVGSPLSGLLLRLDGWLGLQGWQLLFLIEALPAILLGIAAWWALPDRPADAPWLNAAQKNWLEHQLGAEALGTRHVPDMSLSRVMTNPRVLTLALVYAGSSAVSNALPLWQPQIIRSFGLGTTAVSLLNSVPFGFVVVAMLFWARASDRTGERIWSITLPLMISAVTLGLTVFTNALVPSIVILTIALIGTFAFKAPFWALAGEWLSSKSSAAGLAQINALGNLGGFAGTYVIGIVQGATGSFPLALLPLVGLQLVSCGAILAVGYGVRRSTR